MFITVNLLTVLNAIWARDKSLEDVRIQTWCFGVAFLSAALFGNQVFTI